MSLTSIDLGALLPPGLESSSDLIAEGNRLSREVDMGRTLYLEEKGVGSEIEYRRHAAAHGIPCTAVNLGLATWVRDARRARLDLRGRAAPRRPAS